MSLSDLPTAATVTATAAAAAAPPANYLQVGHVAPCTSDRMASSPLPVTAAHLCTV